MPKQNKYKVELTVLDRYEENETEPYDIEDLKADFVDTLGNNDLDYEGEINVIKLE